MKRIVLFLATNLAVVLVLSVVARLLGLDAWLAVPGASRNAALVAVSSGLLQRMNRQEVEAVLGHEMTHVANGDMVTLTLVQGVVNTFVIFLSRVIGNIIDRAVFRSDDGRGVASFV